HITGRLFRLLGIIQAQINAAALLTIADFPAQTGIALQLYNYTIVDCFCHQGISTGGIDADPVAFYRFHQFPGTGILARRTTRIIEPDPAARITAAQHGASIGAMESQTASVRQLNVGEETLIAANQGAALQWQFEFQTAFLSIKCSVSEKLVNHQNDTKLS